MNYMSKIKKLFTDTGLSKNKIMIFAIISAIYTALMTVIPKVKYTLFSALVATLEVCIFFEITIINKL